MIGKNSTESIRDKIFSEARKVADTLGEFKNTSNYLENFIAELMLNSDLSLYEMLGILEESKNVVREIFLSPDDKEEEKEA